MMTIDRFKASLSADRPPQGIHELLEALWHDARGDWHQAHEIAQTQEGTQAYDRLHAYLHRKEGDQWNANYWYRRAKAEMPNVSLAEEWEILVKEMMNYK